MSAAKVMKKYRMAKSTSLLLGLQPASVSRYEEDKKRKSRIDEDKENEAINFFENVGVHVPDRKSVKKEEERKILDRPLTTLY